ncbi:putative ATP-grasp-modified RiPP [Streptomyces sp. NPDC051907]|uniref:putative ATP-grasp-modified RiPP n=1 Tax=Streptomyces sp. NPDC051907 TaxID=3155284 RepID=UPI0034145F45
MRKNRYQATERVAVPTAPADAAPAAGAAMAPVACDRADKPTEWYQPVSVHRSLKDPRGKAVESVREITSDVDQIFETRAERFGRQRHHGQPGTGLHQGRLRTPRAAPETGSPLAEDPRTSAADSPCLIKDQPAIVARGKTTAVSSGGCPTTLKEPFMNTQSPTQPFVLRFAKPSPPEPLPEAYSYDAVSQVNRFGDGRAVYQCREALLALGTTASTAGSKTHFDD